MWQWVKACKGVALVAFFLPWMTVSCTSTELMRASGWDLAIGKPKLSPELAQLAGDRAMQSDAHLSVWLLLALAAIVVGLIVAFRPARTGAPVVVATSIAAVVLGWVGTQRLSTEAIAKASARGGRTTGLDRAMAAQIHVDWQFGVWLCLLALIAAAVLAAMSLSRRSGALP
ncbi:hypothetical protein [Sphingomonas sp.]|uniref:hypothetical protein n=1 Tax=Sphingomonas sp. TaxID=28214 RepID=UPI003AFFBE2C